MQHCVRICLWAHPQCLLTSSIDLIVQPRRFDVYENFGCRSAVYPSVATLFVVWIPPLALSLLTICFCGKSLHYCMYPYEAESLQASLGATFSFTASNFRGHVRLPRLLLEHTFGSSVWPFRKSSALSSRL
jgi:hypothetical protein